MTTVGMGENWKLWTSSTTFKVFQKAEKEN
jgi:hypothetical protein